MKHTHEIISATLAVKIAIWTIAVSQIVSILGLLHSFSFIHSFIIHSLLRARHYADNWGYYLYPQDAQSFHLQTLKTSGKYRKISSCHITESMS